MIENDHLCCDCGLKLAEGQAVLMRHRAQDLYLTSCQELLEEVLEEVEEEI